MAVAIYLRKFLKTPKGRETRDKILLKLPGIKLIVIKMVVARFSRIFASLMGAGVSVIDALEITAKALGNVVVKKNLMPLLKVSRMANN